MIRRAFLSLLLLLPSLASALPYSSMFVFGDSVSDPGNIPAISGVNFPPAPYVNNQFSNGPVAVQYLSPKLGLPLDNSKNFAQGGATTGFDNIFNGSLGGPVPGNMLTGVLGQVGGYLTASGGNTDPGALYVVWAGPNDFAPGLTDPNFNPFAATGQAINNLGTAIGALASAGARHFLVPGMPDLGLTPLAQSLGQQVAGSLISNGFNQALTGLVGNLNLNLGVDIRSFDTAGFIRDIVQNPANFGFTNVTDSCINPSDLTCILNPVVAYGYLFWDDLHPTTHAHALIAAQFASAIPEPATMVLFLAGIPTSIWMRRRHACMQGIRA